MSQRTRARTTGAASKAPDQPPADVTADVTADAPADAPAVSAAQVAAVLRALADEVERDPALAARVAVAVGADSGTVAPAPKRSGVRSARSAVMLTAAAVDTAVTAGGAATPPAAHVFRPTIVPGVRRELGPGVPDPFALAARVGAEGLRGALAEMRIGTLRAIAREHQLVPAARLAKLTDAEKLRALILHAIADRSGTAR